MGANLSSLTYEQLQEILSLLVELSLIGGFTGALLLMLLLDLGAALMWALARYRGRKRGMGQGPMIGASRATYPTARGGATPARQSGFSPCPSHTPGASGRVVKRSEDPRPEAVPQACPDSCLKDKRAEGAPVLRCAHVAGGDSVKTPGVLEELPPVTPGPSLV